MRSQWTDYMEEVLNLITIQSTTDKVENNNGDNNNETRCLFTHQKYPFRLCNISLPQCRTGFVYFLSSVRRQTNTYIGEIIYICQQLKQHNSVFGSTSTTLCYLRPFAVMTSMCRFNGNETLCCFVEQKWQERRDQLILSGINDPRQ